MIKLTQRQTEIFELLLVISIGFLPSIIYSFYLLLSSNAVPLDDGQLIPKYLNGIFHACLSIVLLFYVLQKQGRKITDIGLSFSLEWRDLWHALGLMLLAGVMRMLMVMILGIGFPELFQEAKIAENNGFLGKGYILLLIIYMIVISLQEELIVRGFAMKAIFDLSESTSLAILISVGIQFSYHLYQGYIAAFMLLPFFIVLAVYFTRTGNLKPIILAHVLTNLMLLLYL
jgi:membrane protease YdiL (CAAX protease family)